MKLKKNTIAEILGMLMIASLGLFLISCSIPTNPKVKKTPVNDTAVLATGAHPHLGTSFTDSSYTKDSSLNIIVGSGTKIVYTLVDTNFSIGGKSNVYEFASTVDTMYLSYESNGDITAYIPFGFGKVSIGSEWVTFPCLSQGKISMTNFSSLILADTIQISGSSKGQGIGAYTLSNVTHPAGRALMSADAYDVKLKTHNTEAITLFFAPTLGFFTGYDVSTSGNFAGVNIGGGVHRILLDYDMK